MVFEGSYWYMTDFYRRQIIFFKFDTFDPVKSFHNITSKKMYKK